MIIGVDIGGTKTYIACFAQNGKLLKEVRFETNHNYKAFLADLAHHAAKLETNKAKIACVAVPGLLDRPKGKALSLGNLPWKDEYIQHDLSVALQLEEVHIENDSKLAGLAEARYMTQLSQEHKRIFYLTLSTGIGGAFVIQDELVDQMIDMEIGKMPLLHDGKMVHWEDFASGRAFVERYHTSAVDTRDEKVWEEFSHFINQGLGVICSTFQVDTIIFGGGLGQHLSRFKKYLAPYLKSNLHSIVRQPQTVVSTHYKGQSVIYGCYEYAKDHLA